MNDELSHSRYEDLLAGYVAGILSDREHLMVITHLEHCAACRQIVAEWHLVADLLAQEESTLPTDAPLLQTWTQLRAALPMAVSNSHLILHTKGETIMEPALPTTLQPEPRHRLAFVSIAIVLLVALLSVTLFSTLHHANLATAPITTCQSTKSGETLPEYTHLAQLSMVSTTEGWAVGEIADPQSGARQGAIFHLNQCRWQRYAMSLPGIELDSISMGSADEGWAIGELWKVSSSVDPQDILGMVTLHYSGGQWRQTTVPATQGLIFGEVQMLSPQEGWILGQLPPFPGGAGRLLHWQQGTWQEVAVPDTIAAGLGGSPIQIIAPNDIWMAIEQPAGTGLNHFASSIVHYYGGTWKLYPMQNDLGINGFAFVAANDGWAVGDTGIQPPNQQPSLLHFDGAQWTSVPVPNSGDTGNVTTYLLNISLTSSQEGWADGYTIGDMNQPIFYRLHQGQWQVVEPPLPGDILDISGNSLVIVSADEGWAFVDSHVTTHGIKYGLFFRTTILRNVDGQWKVFER